MSDGVAQPSGQSAKPRSRSWVVKFGGSSLEDGAAIRRAISIVRQRLQHQPVVVASAFAGVTDRLLTAGKAAAQGQPSAVEILESLERRHEALIRDCAAPERQQPLQRAIGSDFGQLRHLLHNAASLGELTPRMQDHLLGLGEVMSSRIVQAAFAHAGLEAEWVDARNCIVTDAAHTQATPLWEQTNQRLLDTLVPLLAQGRVAVLGGFVGSTRDGIPTTLGRGGSDFTASIVGGALQSSRIEIWTDVDGILTTDPKLCPDARRVPTMSFEEAADLAYFGAKVLHPATIAPAMRMNVPVWVLNSRNPEGKGTEIVANPSEECSIKAITAKKGVTVVDVEAVRWLAPEILREIFEVFERHGYSLDLLSASRGSLSLLVTSTAGLAAISEELRGLATVRWQNHKALVSIVGEKVRRQPEIASRVFRAMADVDLRMICQGASERNISFLVDEVKAEDSVRRLHRLFFQSRFDRYSTASPGQLMCQAGGAWH